MGVRTYIKYNVVKAFKCPDTSLGFRFFFFYVFCHDMTYFRLLFQTFTTRARYMTVNVQKKKNEINNNVLCYRARYKQFSLSD